MLHILITKCARSGVFFNALEHQISIPSMLFCWLLEWLTA